LSPVTLVTQYDKEVLTLNTSGGSGGAIYAYIFGWVGTLANFVVLAELTSMYVTQKRPSICTDTFG
jgi:hypothetical protein